MIFPQIDEYQASLIIVFFFPEDSGFADKP